MIFKDTTKKRISVISMFMVLLMGFATAFAPAGAYAAEDDGYGVGDKVKLVHDHQIRYETGFSRKATQRRRISRHLI